VKSFLFVEHLILCILWIGQSMNLDHNKFFIYFKKILLIINLTSTNQVSTNMSTVVKPRNFVPMKLNDFTVNIALLL